MIFFISITILKFLIIVVLVLLSVAILTLTERITLADFQCRQGPNLVGFGCLQPIADGLKLFVKETVLPSNSDLVIFVIAPIVTLTLSLVGWAVIPFEEGAVVSDIQLGVLYLFSVSSLSIYGIITSGWSSNSKYAFLGSLRSAAQMISYEVSIGFIIVCVAVCAGSFNLTEIVLAQEEMIYCIPLAPALAIFFISVLAETNRHPFDLPEAEAELVSGYNVEYSAMGFALFFIGEYSNILLMSVYITILFFGGWLQPTGFIYFLNDWFPSIDFTLLYLYFSIKWFTTKISFVIFLIMSARVFLPRYRYDQLMMLGWKVFLPFSVSCALLTSSILINFNWLPV